MNPSEASSLVKNAMANGLMRAAVPKPAPKGPYQKKSLPRVVSVRVEDFPPTPEGKKAYYLAYQKEYRMIQKGGV